MHHTDKTTFSHGATIGRWLLTGACLLIGISLVLGGFSELIGANRSGHGCAENLILMGVGCLIFWGGTKLLRSTLIWSLQKKAALQERIDAGREPGSRLKFSNCLGECPHCGSEHTQKCSAVYDAGTTHTTSVGSGGGYTPQGGYVSVTTWNSNTHQTVLAKRCARPEGRFGLLAGIGYSILAGFASMVCPPFALLIPVLLAFGARGTRRNFKELPQQRAAWEEQWYCHRCDSFFRDGGNAPVVLEMSHAQLTH